MYITQKFFTQMYKNILTGKTIKWYIILARCELARRMVSVKRNISILIAIVILVLVVIVNYNMTKEAIINCVEGGNNYKMCINTLK